MKISATKDGGTLATRRTSYVPENVYGPFDSFFSSIFGNGDIFPKDWLDTYKSAKVTDTVREENGNLIYEIEVPGVKKNDISVKLEASLLLIEWKRGGMSYKRTFTVSSEVTDTSAKLEDGILTVTLKIKDKAAAKTIKVT